MRLPSTYTAVVLASGLGWAVACGGSSLDRSGGGAGDAGTGGGSGSGATGGGGGSGGSSGGSGGASGSSSGTSGSSSGTSGSSSGGAGGGDTGGKGGTGGSTGGAMAGAGLGGTSGVGGTAAGAGGTVAGSAGCGFCPFVACAPAVTLTVTGGETLADVEGTIRNASSGAELGALSCFPNGGTPCSWYCQFYQLALGDGDYAIELSAPGYGNKTVEFSVQNPTNCGCCGCGCGPGYTGDTALEPDGGEIPACCAALAGDTRNCGACGNECETGYTCTEGECTEICSGPSTGCSGSTYPCCAGLTCCPPDSLGQRQCLESCP